jgi:HAD superfamily hydrolase (TIGR01549 family)
MFPRLKAIVFDFDGVILESNDIKTRAFRDLFSAWPEHVEAMVRYHLDHRAISRFEKFKVFLTDYLKQPASEAELQRMGNEFSRLVFEAVVQCPFVPGAFEFLERFSRSHVLYVASGTPEDELRQIVALRDLNRFFRGVYGSPRKKAVIIADIVQQDGYDPAEVLFIGDALEDYRGARAAAVHFVGRKAPGYDGTFPEEGTLAVVDDLNTLAHLMQSTLDS